MAVNDSWIAATATALGVPVVTQDADSVDVPGLVVVHACTSSTSRPAQRPASA